MRSLPTERGCHPAFLSSLRAAVIPLSIVNSLDAFFHMFCRVIRGSVSIPESSAPTLKQKEDEVVLAVLPD